MATLILGISGARGIVGDGLDTAVVVRLAQAYAQTVHPQRIVIGRDSRPSGPLLVAAVRAALQTVGCAVIELGVVPTPTVQVAVEELQADGGIVVTASHNPPEWNALKFIGAQGTFLDGATMERLTALYHASPSGPAQPLSPPPCAAASEIVTVQGQRVMAEHVRRILGVVDAAAIAGSRLRVVVDAVHGAGGILITPLLAELGVGVEWVNGEPNGELPPLPEPRSERLHPLRAVVADTGADLGFALDPDGDRCAAVVPSEVLGEEWTLPLCAWGRLQRGGRGPLVANLSTSARIEHVAEHFGVPCYRTPVGEAHVVARMRAVGALIGGEGNGGVIDPAVHFGRDAGVAIASLLELEAAGPGGRGGLAQTAAGFPPRALLKRKLRIDAQRRGELEARLCAALGEPGQRDDGLRWTWGAEWLHVRPSGTEPIVRLFAESADAAHAARLVARVEEALRGLGSVEP